MSGRLVAEVLEHAPQDLTSAELLVLIALAEDARDLDRQSRFNGGVTDLMRRTRLKESTVKNVLVALVKRG